MDFELTRRQRRIREEAREFARFEIRPEVARELDRTHRFPWQIWKKACQAGLIAVHFPEELGGRGMGIFENCLVVEEFCRADSGIGVALSLADFASEIILRFGTKEQKERYLPPIPRGEAISAGGFTEPDHGSDITLMSTRAVKEGDHFVINGTKTFITNGAIADYAVVLCQTDPGASPTYRGQSTIVVERGTPGFQAREIGEKLGIRMTSTAELVFEEVRVPVANLIGEQNRGFYQVLEFFDESRIEIAAQAVGMAQGALERAMEFVSSEGGPGRGLAGEQYVRHRLAEMATKVEAVRLLVYKAAWNFDQGRIDFKLTSMAKFWAGRVASEVVGQALQLLGDYGYLEDFHLERFYRDVCITEIYEGTKEVQKNTIASALLGRARRGHG